MTLIRRTNPLGELMSLRQAMDRLFEDSFVRPSGQSASDDYQLPVNIRTTADELVVEAALPGVKPDDVDITVLGDTLTINAAHSSDQSRDNDGYTYREIRRGSFSRQLTLPGGLKTDAASASFDNGLLTLTIPKAEEVKPRQIPIGHGSMESANGRSHSTESQES
jgi:HSP20 family protein